MLNPRATDHATPLTIVLVNSFASTANVMMILMLGHTFAPIHHRHHQAAVVTANLLAP
jgi:hypothetical protein